MMARASAARLPDKRLSLRSLVASVMAGGANDVMQRRHVRRCVEVAAEARHICPKRDTHDSAQMSKSMHQHADWHVAGLAGTWE